MKQRGEVMVQLFVLAVIVAAVVFVAVVGKNSWAKSFGSAITYHSEPGYRVVNMSWKDSNLWILYENESEFMYKEYSNYGIVNGLVRVTKTK